MNRTLCYSGAPRVMFAVALGLVLGPGCRWQPTTTANRDPAPSLSGPRPQFTDRTEAAGLAFRQPLGGCGLHFFVEQVAAGASLIDVDGDGNLDLYFQQPKPLGNCRFPEPLRQRLYRNDGHGRFRLSPHAFPHETDYGIGSAVGDYDNDGHPDLYVSCYGKSTLFRNRGDGTFEDVTDRAGVGVQGLSAGAAWFDFDRDGYLDLYVGRYCEWTVATDIPCPGPNGQRGACHPSTYRPAFHVLYHNNRDGTFTNVTDKAGVARVRGRALGIAAADFDNDGWLDLFVANDLAANFLYHNRGDGTFQEVAMQQNVAYGPDGRPQANMGLAVGDYDEDGDLDVLVTTFTREPDTLYRNDGAYFTDVSLATRVGPQTTGTLGFGAGFIDTRNNGLLDFFVANGHVSPWASGGPYKEHNQLLVNDGSGHYVDEPAALPPDDVRVHRAACFGDVDNDGRVDILVTASDDRPTLLQNDTAAGNWISLRLRDARGCITPVGARCTATIGTRRLLRVLVGGGSYGGSSDQRVHFGLGKATQVDRLEIRWPSGKTQVLTNVPGNRTLDVREPS